MAYALFWSAGVLLALGSFGYPILLWVWAQLAPRRTVESLQRLPTVSVVLPFYNEAPYIAAKIENLLGLAYPAELLELVLVCARTVQRFRAMASEVWSFAPTRVVSSAR